MFTTGGTLITITKVTQYINQKVGEMAPVKFRGRQGANYPLKPFKNNIQALMDKHPDKPNAAQLAAHIGVTPLTMRRIIDGMDVRLSMMRNIAKVFDCEVGEIWPLK